MSKSAETMDIDHTQSIFRLLENAFLMRRISAAKE